MKLKAIPIVKKQGSKAFVMMLLSILLLALLATGMCSAAAFEQSMGDGTSAAVSSGMLPQVGGISPATLIGLLGLACITTGGTVITILFKKNHTKDN